MYRIPSPFPPSFSSIRANAGRIEAPGHHCAQSIDVHHDVFLDGRTEHEEIKRIAWKRVAAVNLCVLFDCLDHCEAQVDRFKVMYINLSQGVSNGPESLRGAMTLRVPSDSLDEALDRMQALATGVSDLKLNRQDVTDRYSDLDARLRNLRATETELLALLTEVRARPNAKVEDILAVHRSLTQIREEIETLQGRKNLLDNRIEFSTVRVELIPDSVYRPIVEVPWSASEPVRNALRALVATLQGLLTALIWALLYLAPLLLVFLIPLAALIWMVRLWIRQRRKDGTEPH